MPEDYAELQRKITDRLTAVVTKDETLRQTAEMVSKLEVVPSTKGLSPHEVLALTLIFEEQFSFGISFSDLSSNMRKAGYLRVATSLAVSELQKKKMIEPRNTSFEFGDMEQLFATAIGEDWLLRNQHELNLRKRREPEAMEITADDIPF